MVTRSMLVVLAYVVICWVFGRLMFVLAKSRPEALGYAGMPLLGGFAMGLQLWVFGAGHIPWHPLTLLVPWLVAAVIARGYVIEAARADSHRARAAIAASGGLDHLSWTLLAVALLLVATYLISLVTQPLTGWDALAIWGIKAKLFAARQAVDLTEVADQVKRHLDYPPLFPLMTDSLYVLIGRVDDIAGKAVNLLFLVAAGATMYAVLRDIAGRGLAIIFMFLVVALPIFQPFLLSTAYMGYADYAVSVCILLSLANLQSSATGGGWTSSMMAVVFAGMAALVKNEGLPLLGIVILAVLARFLLQARTEGRLTIPRAPAVLMLAGVIPVVVWQWWARAHGYHSDLTSNRQLATLLPQLPGRQRTIDHFLKAMPARSNDYGWLAVGFALSVILMTVNRLRYGLTLLAVVLVELAVYDFAFLFTPYDLSWHLSTAMDRVVLQMTPALLLLLAVSLAPYIMGNSPLSRAYRHDAG